MLTTTAATGALRSAQEGEGGSLAQELLRIQT